MYFDALKIIIAFMLGLLSTPLVEFLKDKFKRYSLKRHMIQEIADEIDYLKISIPMMAMTLKTLRGLQKGQIDEIVGPIHYVPRVTNLIFYNEYIVSCFRYLSTNQRLSIKNMKGQFEWLNRYCDDLLVSGLEEEEQDKLMHDLEQRIEICKKYIYTACCFKEALEVFVYNREPLIKDPLIINEQLSNLGIDSCQYDSLIKKKKISVPER